MFLNLDFITCKLITCCGALSQIHINQIEKTDPLPRGTLVHTVDGTVERELTIVIKLNYGMGDFRQPKTAQPQRSSKAVVQMSGEQ